MNTEKHVNENEQLERAEHDRDVRIAEQKRFDRVWDKLSQPSQELLNRWYSHVSNRERMMDIEIYKEGRLEF